MNIGGLTIEMVADIANLRTSMGEAKTVTSSAMDDITKSAGIAVEALASLGAITTLAGMGALITSTISGAAELYKLSQVTGVTVESLSALAGPAKLTGTSMDTVSAALVKLSKNMVEAQDGTGKSADAFRALGIDVHNSDGTLKTADQTMLDVAMSLEGFRDGAGKTSVELALFGKTGAELSPMLQALAEKGDLNGKITTEQAEACRQFELAQKKLTMEVAGFFKSIAWDLIPILLKARPILIDLAEITAVAVGVFVIAPAAIALAVSAYEALVVAYTVAGSVGALFTVGMQGISAAVMATVASVGLLNIALGAVMIIFAAFKIAEWAYENFEPARRLMNDFFVAAAIGWEYIKYGAEVAWLGIKAVTMPVIDFISGAWSLYSDMLIASWQLIQSAAAAAWDAIRTQVDAALTWISSAWAPLVNALGAGWSFIKDSAAVAWSGIQTAVSDVLTWVNATWIASIELVAEGLRAIGADGTAAKVSAFAEKLKSATASGDEFKTEMKALDVGLQAGLQSVYKMGEGLVKQSQNHFAAKTSAGDQRDVLKTLTDTTGAAADESKKDDGRLGSH